MSYEKTQSTMQFILEQQAQYTVRLQKDEEWRGELERNFVLLNQLAHKARINVARLCDFEQAVDLLTQLVRRADRRTDML